jgi:hypothetical protein
MENDLGKPIAYGRTAEIYAWGEWQVLKLFYDWVGLGAVQFEQGITEMEDWLLKQAERVE